MRKLLYLAFLLLVCAYAASVYVNAHIFTPEWTHAQ